MSTVPNTEQQLKNAIEYMEKAEEVLEGSRNALSGGTRLFEEVKLSLAKLSKIQVLTHREMRLLREPQPRPHTVSTE